METPEQAERGFEGLAGGGQGAAAKGGVLSPLVNLSWGLFSRDASVFQAPHCFPAAVRPCKGALAV